MAAAAASNCPIVSIGQARDFFVGRRRRSIASGSLASRLAFVHHNARREPAPSQKAYALAHVRQYGRSIKSPSPMVYHIYDDTAIGPFSRLELGSLSQGGARVAQTKWHGRACVIDDGALKGHRLSLSLVKAGRALGGAKLWSMKPKREAKKANDVIFCMCATKWLAQTFGA